jgi:hypothetical protein
MSSDAAKKKSDCLFYSLALVTFASTTKSKASFHKLAFNALLKKPFLLLYYPKPHDMPNRLYSKFFWRQISIQNRHILEQLMELSNVLLCSKTMYKLPKTPKTSYPSSENPIDRIGNLTSIVQFLNIRIKTHILTM